MWKLQLSLQNSNCIYIFSVYILKMAERPEDLNLPTSIVTKIIKDCLPNTCKVSKEANAAIAKVKKGRTVNNFLLLCYTLYFPGRECVCAVRHLLCEHGCSEEQ